MNDGVQQQTQRVYENMALLALDLFARVIAMRIDAAPLFQRSSRFGYRRWRRSGWLLVPRPKPFTVTASEKMPFVQALWVNSFFSNAGAGGCCAATGMTTRHTTAVAIRAAKLRMGTSSGRLTAFNHLIRGRSACELRPRRVAPDADV